MIEAGATLREVLDRLAAEPSFTVTPFSFLSLLHRHCDIHWAKTRDALFVGMDAQLVPTISEEALELRWRELVGEVQG